MTTESEQRRQYWNSLANLPPDTAVLDPQDIRGAKNAYLASIRDDAFRSALSRHRRAGSLVLDLGCGTGSATRGMLDEGHQVLGVDIARELLKQAVMRCNPARSLFVATDGTSIPVKSGSFDAVATYVVMSYIVDDDAVLSVLNEVRRALKPGGKLVAIEQCRRKFQIVDEGLKAYRTIGQWRGLLAEAGFSNVNVRVLRNGRFPTTPLVRMGWIPARAWPTLRRAERICGRIMGVIPGDYAEVIFECTA